MHPERITWEDKKLVNSLNYHEVWFPVQKKKFLARSKKRTTFA